MRNFDSAIKLLKEINSYGYDAYIVGGAVRDSLLGLAVYDIDIATSMPLDEICKRFQVLDNGSKFLSVTIEYDGFYYETTNFRLDIEYHDHRHPIVKFVKTFKEDSIRRDFTINAMAYDHNMNLLDYHNGEKDINDRLIRTINDPDIRFKEDALRILRALYLASKLSFDIEENTLKAIIKNKELLKTLSNERIYEFLLRFFNSLYLKGLEYINKYDLFEHIKEFKDWLFAIGSNLDKDNLCYSYYIKNNKYPPIITTFQRKICDELAYILADNFSLYSLYKYKSSYIAAKEAFRFLGYDVVNIDRIINEMKINNDKELAVSKEAITMNFIGKDKGIAVKKVICAILEGKINNNEEEIYSFLNRS